MEDNYSKTNKKIICDFVFVVLVYRNTADLIDFFENLKVKNCRVIVVNSFYDEESENEFKEIANKYEAAFLSVPNKGYGAGNNRGCEYALQNYFFKYLIISNADVVVKKIDLESLNDKVITAPNIVDRNGKKQNPSCAYYDKFVESLNYYLLDKKLYRIVIICSILNKIEREFFYFTHFLFNKKKISQAHGANIIFPYKIITMLYPIFNEEIFLFCEEPHLSRKASLLGVSIEYNDKIVVFHKEDGSVSYLNSESHSEMVRDSFLKYYEYWHNKNL